MGGWFASIPTYLEDSKLQTERGNQHTGSSRLQKIVTCCGVLVSRIIYLNEVQKRNMIVGTQVSICSRVQNRKYVSMYESGDGRITPRV